MKKEKNKYKKELEDLKLKFSKRGTPVKAKAVILSKSKKK